MNTNSKVVLRRYRHLTSLLPLRRLRSCHPSLAMLLPQWFARVPYALVLVRVGRAQGTDVCGYLADHLLVISGQHQVGLFVDFELNTRRQQNLDGVRIAQRESCDVALHVGAISDARNIQLAGKTRSDA